MAKIICPNKQYTGISATVPFVNGVGETDNPNLITWFKSKGYIVVEDEAGDELSRMDVDELKAYAEANDINIGNATSRNGILKKIREAEAKGEE